MEIETDNLVPIILSRPWKKSIPLQELGIGVSRKCGFRMVCKEGSVDSRDVRWGASVIPGRSDESMMKAIESENWRLGRYCKDQHGVTLLWFAGMEGGWYL